MIFPERVLGNPFTNCILSALAIGPTSFVTILLLAYDLNTTTTNNEQINEVFNQKFIRTIAAIRRVENQAYLKVISSWEREFLLLNV